MSDDHDVTFTEEMTGELALTGQAIDSGRVVRPGDILVLSTSRDVDPDTAARVREQIERRFPELASVLVMSGIRFEFVYREDDTS